MQGGGVPRCVRPRRSPPKPGTCATPFRCTSTLTPVRLRTLPPSGMPPEKRAQMEAYLKEHGVGMSVGPGGMPMMTMRVCLTPQDVAEESGKSLFKHLKENGDCTTKVITQSASETHIVAHCSAADGHVSDMDARIFDISAVHYSVDMKGHGARGDMHMQQQARWVGSDCKGAF